MLIAGYLNLFSNRDRNTLSSLVPALSPLPVPPKFTEWGPGGTKGLETVLTALSPGLVDSDFQP